MEEENKEVVAEEVTQETNEVTVDESKFESAGDDSVIKVDLSKPIEEDATGEQSTDEVPVRNESETSEEVREENVEEQVEELTGEEEQTVQDDKPVVEEITQEEVKQVAEEVQDAIIESEATGSPLPENVQKLVDFMNDTGGDLEDYVKLNRDYSELDSQSLLVEYYRQTKPHLNAEEINFMMEDSFSFDEDIDDDRDIRRKKLALKEQVAQAKNHLESVKSNYYEEIKHGSKLTKEQQKAIDFFNRYNEDSKESKKVAEDQHNTFINKTNDLFNKDFKGFEYNVGEKKFRFNVKDSNTVKDTQSDVNNFVKKFLNKDNQMSDAKGYHKALYTAMNSDKIASHFYEQGKADALKNSVAKSKNISMDPRQQHSGEISAGGIKVRVLGENSNDFKFKIKN